MTHLIDDRRHTSLLDLLSISVVFDSLIVNLSLQSISHLSQLSRSFRSFVNSTPECFRYLDLSKSRIANASQELANIDSGGQSWRSQRMDENLTEDEFYAGPLMGILSVLRRKSILPSVQVLVLDGLDSATNDFVADIATRPDLRVRILSIRKCKNINPTRLQQFLKFICRPERPEGTPRLQGVYYFTEPAVEQRNHASSQTSNGVTTVDGATLGTLPADKSRGRPDGASWYTPFGKVIETGHGHRTSWEETLLACRGIIAFDAVLCTHMHAAMSAYLHDASRDALSSDKPGIPTIATVALGPEGCSGCGTAPPGSPVWGDADMFEFPLLWPPPRSGQIIDAVRPPVQRRQGASHQSQESLQKSRLIVSCTWCLANRHCDSCHRWWCGDCYNPKKSKKLSDLEALSNAGLSNYLPSREELSMSSNNINGGTNNQGDSVKVFNGLCVEDCLVGVMMSGAGSFGMWA